MRFSQPSFRGFATQAGKKIMFVISCWVQEVLSIGIVLMPIRIRLLIFDADPDLDPT
jgi:hypothetical protein